LTVFSQRAGCGYDGHLESNQRGSPIRMGQSGSGALRFSYLHRFAIARDRTRAHGPARRKARALAYSVTGLLLGLAMSKRNAPILAALNLALLACLLEFLQQWSAGRHPRVSDAVVGALAGMLGAGLSAWLRKGAEAHLNGVCNNRSATAPTPASVRASRRR
jgi:VanZ family protein